MKKSMMDELRTQSKPDASHGFTLLEVMIVMTIIAIVSTFAVLGITRSRNSMGLQNSARLFASYLEKARLGAIRRNEATNIDITGPSTYTVTMDFDGTGNVGVRTFTLEQGVVFTDSTNTAYTVNGSGNVISSNGEAVSWADFNWRGRTSQCSMLFRMQNSNNERSTVQVTGSGDITIDTGVSTPATVTTVAVNTNADVLTSAVVKGTFSHPELNPCSTSGGGGSSAIAAPVATCPGGSISANVGSVSVRKNLSTSTATVSITVSGPGTITATPNSNLQVTPATQSVTSASGGTFNFSIRSITTLRASNPPFTVVFSNPCSSFPIYVTVTS